MGGEKKKGSGEGENMKRKQRGRKEENGKEMYFESYEKN